MKQYKVSILLVVFLAFVAILGFKRMFEQTKTPANDSGPLKAAPFAVPTQSNTLAQQMAIEVVPATASAPAAPFATPQLTKTPTATGIEKGRVLSYIEFISLPNNYAFQSYGIDWRTYREYRSALAVTVD